jgi:hypothetical protein
METIIRNCLSGLKLGEVKAFENMEVFPLFKATDGGPQYAMLKEALQKQMIVITELHESGSVPQLKVVNHSEQFVLLLDGEELMGAKQNRVLNTSILMAAKSETIIPVSCTEQGRWSYRSAAFQDSDVIMAAKVRSRKSRSVTESLKEEQCFHSDQGEVWAQIASLHRMAAVGAETGAMKDVFTARRRDLEGYLKAFPYAAGRQGILVRVNGRIVGMDLLSRQTAHEQIHAKLVKSYAMDALLEHSRGMAKTTVQTPENFLEDARNSKESRFESPGVGYDYRLEGGRMVGSALVFEGAMIHLAFFSLEKGEQERPMSGYRRRRSFRRPHFPDGPIE